MNTTAIVLSELNPTADSSINLLESGCRSQNVFQPPNAGLPFIPSLNVAFSSFFGK